MELNFDWGVMFICFNEDGVWVFILILCDWIWCLIILVDEFCLMIFCFFNVIDYWDYVEEFVVKWIDFEVIDMVICLYLIVVWEGDISLKWSVFWGFIDIVRSLVEEVRFWVFVF